MLGDAFEVAQHGGGDLDGIGAKRRQIVRRRPIAFIRAPTDEAFHGGNNAARIDGPGTQGGGTDGGDVSILRKTNHRGCESAAVRIGEQDWEAAVHDTHEGVRGAEIDAEDEFRVRHG